MNTLREIIIDFIFQDASLMDHLFLKLPIYSKSEIIIKTIIFSLVFSGLWFLVVPKELINIVTIIVLAHSINWFLTGHGLQKIFDYVLNGVFGLQYTAQKAIDYILKLKREAENKNLLVMIYGSWSRGEATCSSDIDVFIVNAQRSIVSGLRLAFISLKYRLFAAAKSLSVDIYVIDRVEYLEWRRHAKPEERPIILNDPTGVIGSIYKESGTGFNDFLNAIMRVYKSH